MEENLPKMVLIPLNIWQNFLFFVLDIFHIITIILLLANLTNFCYVIRVSHINLI